jgi:serine/threonine protein phosphatase PrpC
MNGNYWNGWGVTQIGPAHLRNGMPNQDSYLVKNFQWGIIGVVCDGLGSKKYSHIGSKALVLAVAEASDKFDFEITNTEEFEILVKSLWEKNIYPYSCDDCATTLLFAIIKKDTIYTGRVGDGMICILGEENIIIEENKNSFTNYTTPFGRDESIEWQKFNVKKIESLVLCSDGISEDIQKEKSFAFCEKYILKYKNQKKRKRENEIKEWLKKWPVKGHSDDKTIVALVKMDQHEEN